MKRFGKICLSLAAIFGAALSLASCSKKVWTVEFLDGTNSLSTQQVNNKETVNKPADPTKTDYVFDDWYAEETFSTKFNFDTKIVSDTKIYAKFNQTVFTIKFNTNGGSEIEDKKVNLLETLVLPDNPTKDGGKFEGWFTDASLSQAFDATTKINSNLTLYAKWSDIVTLTFNSNGGSAITVQTIKKGSKAVAVEAPEKKGYTFVDWYKDETLETAFNFETEVLNENTVIYAKWNRLPDPFGNNTGFGTLEGKELLSWEDLLTWAPVDSGVKFTEDLTSGNYTFGKGARIDTNILNTQGKNIIVVLDGVDGANAIHVKLTGASSTKVGNVRLYKDDLEGTPLYESGRVLENKSVLTLDFEDLANGTYIINIKDDTVTDGDASVSAKVDYIYNDVIEKVTVTFDSDGGAAVDPQTIVKGSKATAPTSPEKASYRFDGWFLGEATTAFDFAAVVTEDITLKAHWTLLSNPVTVKVYNLNLVDPSSSELLDTLAGEKDEEMTVTPKTITGFKFISLFDENGKYVPVTFTPTADTNLYALYEKTSYALADDNGDFALLIKDGANITLSGSNVVFSSSIAPLNKEDKDIKESEISNAYVFEALFKGKLTITFDIKGKDGAVAADKTIALYVFVADENGTVTHKESAELNTANPVITNGTLEFDVNGFNRLYIGRKGGTALYLSDLTIECEIEDSNILEIHYMDEGEEKSENIEVYKSETIGEALTLRYFQAGKNYVVKESKDATEVFDTNVKLTGYRTLFIAEEAIEYTLKCVYVDGDNTEVLETSKFNVNDGILINNGPDKAHKLFIDWFFDKSLTKGINGAKFDDFVKACDENNTLTLYARYDDAATLTLKVDDDVYQVFTVVKNTKLTAGDLENVKLELEKTGYNFLGWFVTENNVDTKITIDTNYKVEKDTVANAKFEKKTYTVTFDADGGVFADATLASQTVAYDTVISAPAVSKSAHNFLGWFLADETTAYDFSNAIKGALAFKAHWELDTTVVTRDVTITSNVQANEKTIQVENGSSLTQAQLEVTNYEITGVYTDSNKGTTVTLPVEVTANLDLYVEYASTLYTVTIEVNDTESGTVSASEVVNVPKNTIITVTNNTLSINGTDVTATANDTDSFIYSFVNWTGLPENNKVVGPVTITANFAKEVVPFTIKFGTTTGSHTSTAVINSFITVVGATDKAISIDTAQTKIATFTNGIYTGDTSNVTYYRLKTGGAASTTERYVILDLSAANTSLPAGTHVMLQFFLAPSSSNSARKLMMTTDISNGELQNLAQVGHDFNNQDVIEVEAIVGNKYYFGSNTSGLNFYAINVLPVKQVTFNVNALNGSAVTEVLGNKYSLSYTTKPVKDYYGFTAWYTGYDSTNKTYSNELVKKAYINEGVTLYAKWTPTQYTITYENAKSATISDSLKSYNIESEDVTLPTITADGYKSFDGWFTEAEGGTKVTKVATGSTGNKIFYAHWTPITYTIAYDANGGTGAEMATTTNCVYDQEVQLSANTYTRDGFTFDGWAKVATATTKDFADQANVKELTTEEGATVTLYAVWKSASIATNKVTVQFHDANGKANIGSTVDIIVDSGTTLTSSLTVLTDAIPAASKTAGYETIVGIYSDSALTTAITSAITTDCEVHVAIGKTYSLVFGAGDVASSIQTTVNKQDYFNIVGSSDYSVAIDSNSKSYDGVSYTHRCKLGGTMSSTYRYIEIDLSSFVGRVEIKVIALSSSSSEARPLKLVADTTSGTEVGRETISGTNVTALTVSNLNASTKYYVGSAEGGINIYAIYVTPVAA